MVKDDSKVKPENIKVEEKKFVTICGWYVGIDSIWIGNGLIKADLVMWSENHKKPFSGGYRKGSSVQIGSTDCIYYVSEIKKFGKNNEKPGYVLLSVTKPENITTKSCPEKEEIEATTVARIGDLKFGLGYVTRGEDGKMVASICPPMNSPLGADIDIREGDTLWVGECAYNVEKIVDGHRTKDGRYENGYIVLSKLKQKITGEGPLIPGEMMSRPPLNLEDVPEHFGKKRQGK